MVLSIIFAILLAVFLLILGYFVYYIVDVIKTFLRMMHKVENIIDSLKHEQQLIEDIAHRSKNTVEGIQAIVATAEEIFSEGKELKNFWGKKKKTKKDTIH